MVTRTAPDCQTAAWRRELARAFTEAPALLAHLGLSPQQVPDLDPAPDGFPLRVPRPFAALMEPGNPQDPLLRQVLPCRQERVRTPGYCQDPVGDGRAARLPGLLHKYRGRVLLMAHGACAVHCRYCFRRHFPYRDLAAGAGRWDGAIARIASDPSIAEVILSGGEPLLLDDSALGRLLARLATIPHVQRLRLHTRLPVVLPERVTDRLCSLLAGLRPTPVLVLHTNHPQELGAAARTGLQALAKAGITLLNQCVLLRGVNDSLAALSALSEALFDCKVLPYYLHQLDPVQGAAHFAVNDPDARLLLDGLRDRLPGYLVPRLVREVPGAPAKLPVAADPRPGLRSASSLLQLTGWPDNGPRELA